MPECDVGGATLAYEQWGEGLPLVWCHEFAGSMESWQPQVAFFARRYRVIVYNARGYPPSSVPDDPAAYSQDIAVRDLVALLKHLGIERAYIGGLSMGGATALHFGLQHPELALGLIVAGSGTGSTDTPQFREQCDAFADALEREGMEGLTGYTLGPTRIQLRRKDPAGWQVFSDLFARHSPQGAAHTLRGVQGGREPLYSYEPQLDALDVPVLILVGDEDEPCLAPSLFMKPHIKRSGLVVLPQSGHTLNLEEPQLFNRAVLDFLTAVESGAWAARESGSGVGFLAGGSAAS